MKNRIITYILLGVLGVLPLTSCSDYLDKMPDDQLRMYFPTGAIWNVGFPISIL